VKRHEFQWSHGRAEVLSTAAMLSRCVFVLDGNPFEPLAVAGWAGARLTGYPGHLRELGGEFVCLPFGDGGVSEGVVNEWRGVNLTARNQTSHGPAADQDWEFIEPRKGGATLRLEYPDDSPVKWVERRIDGVEGEATMRLSLTIAARREARVSVGLHPIIRLPERPGALRVAAIFSSGLTYPATLPPGAARAVPGERFSALTEVPVEGGVNDFGLLPFDSPAEEVVQLCGVQEPIVVEFLDEGAFLVIDWDRALLPSAQLWISDRRLEAAPWAGRYRGLGIEPIASAFDFAEAVSIGANPISDAGFATSVTIVPATPVVINYSLKAAASDK
jgi:hypothetical protein